MLEKGGVLMCVRKGVALTKAWNVRVQPERDTVIHPVCESLSHWPVPLCTQGLHTGRDRGQRGFLPLWAFLILHLPPPVITRKWRKIETSRHCEGSFSSQGPKVTLCDCRFSHLSCPTSVSRPAFYWIRSIGLYCKDEENAALPTKQFLP